MAQDINYYGSWTDVPYVELPKIGGGTAKFTDVTDTTASAADVSQNKYFYTASGVYTQGSSTGGGADSTFVITLSWNSTSEMWEPDCTYAEAAAAYQAGKDLVAEGPTIDDMVAADCIWDADHSVLYYMVYWTDSAKWQVYVYELNVDGIYQVWDDSISIPSGTVPANTTVSADPDEPITVGGVNYRMEGPITVAAIPSGTAGNPIASKGAVSNHALSVTPSVTNSTGYIVGGTKTGTAVTVSASELVSGTLNIVENGTGINVVNYASVDIAVPSGNSYTATISGTGNSSNCYARVNNTGDRYYANGSTFTFTDTDEIYFYCCGSRGGGTITLNGTVVEYNGYSPVSYTLASPRTDMTISMVYSNDSSIAVTVPELSITQNGKYNVSEYASVNVAVPTSTPSLQAKTNIAPTTSSQTITADSGYDGLSSVQINAMPSGTAGTPTATKGTVSNHAVSITPSVTNTTGYITGSTITGVAISVSASELVSGSDTVTANGTVDVTNLASLIVNVASGGGASNVVCGEFTTPSTTTASTITIPYTGSGYPIIAYFCIKGGAYTSGTTWYNAIQRYAIGAWAMSKANMSSAPTYGTSGSENQGVTMSIYKNSTSNATSYTRTSAMTTNVFTSSNASNAAATAIRFKTNAKTVSYYTNTSSYGLYPNQTYQYCIVYSS